MVFNIFDYTNSITMKSIIEVVSELKSKRSNNKSNPFMEKVLSSGARFKIVSGHPYWQANGDKSPTTAPWGTQG